MRDVSFSRGFKWFVILLLPLTLFWKITTRVGTASPTLPSVHERVTEFFVRHHFSIAPKEWSADGTPIVRATAGPCRILAIGTSSMAWERDMNRRYATADDRVFVVFGGRIYAEQPTWLTVPNFLWWRLRRELGWNVQPTSLVTVIANPVCEADRLPWGELG